MAAASTEEYGEETEDDDEDGAYDYSAEDDGSGSATDPKVMDDFLSELRERLKVECNTKKICEDKWLLEYLKHRLREGGQGRGR